MDFTISHEFPVSAEKYWNFTFSDPYMKGIRESMNLKVYEAVERTKKGDKEIVRMHTVPEAQLPKVVKKILGNKDFESWDTYELDHKNYSIKWTNENNLVSGDRAKAGGKMYLTVLGKNKVRRTIEGKIDINIPLVGKQVEKFIVSQMKDRFEEQAVFLQAWAKDNK